MGAIRVGISSWTEPTLVKASTFYPKDAKTAEDRLRFYTRRFPIVEVDSTFYSLPQEKTAQLWVERTPKGFTFDAKAFALLTQHPSPAARLPKDIRERLSVKEGANVYFKDLGAKDRELIWDRFREGLQPLHDAGKLGAVLFQFPKWFLPSPSSYRFMEDLREWLPEFGLAIEFRQAAWLREDRRERVLEFLRQHGMTYVVVDEPQGFTSSVPPVVATTAPLAMVRFHGRNRETWEKKGISTAEKFKYLYSTQQLADWVPKVRAMAEQAKEVHAIFNNCYADYSVRNAEEFAEMLR
ncbi:MAG TPA: DUF72 domain-containing protein [Candidatus Limnocylindrales bacterium]|nr:DUF72 domain-containing protein [Candidatus Limnocylindrales bacterium]